jgi:hypothetical protein
MTEGPSALSRRLSVPGLTEATSLRPLSPTTGSMNHRGVRHEHLAWGRHECLVRAKHASATVPRPRLLDGEIPGAANPWARACPHSVPVSMGAQSQVGRGRYATSERHRVTWNWAVTGSGGGLPESDDP